MARATTKKELLDNSTYQFEKLWELIESIPQNFQTTNFDFDDRDKNIRDVLIHLYEWHQLLINWVTSNKNNIAKQFLPEPYNWKTYPEMNIEFWKKHQKTSYKKAINIIKKSHDDVMEAVNLFSDQELFTKSYFNWTGTTSLGSYCISATASHYDWAIKKIKKHKKLSEEI